MLHSPRRQKWDTDTEIDAWVDIFGHILLLFLTIIFRPTFHQSVVGFRVSSQENWIKLAHTALFYPRRHRAFIKLFVLFILYGRIYTHGKRRTDDRRSQWVGKSEIIRTRPENIRKQERGGSGGVHKHLALGSRGLATPANMLPLPACGLKC